MVAIGRALISNPKVLLCDEISLGLAPISGQKHLRSLSQNQSKQRISDRCRAGYCASAKGGGSRVLHDGGARHPKR